MATASFIPVSEYLRTTYRPDCDYIDGDQLDIERWVRDALVFALPDKILDRPDCPGLCPHCGVRLEPEPLVIGESV